MADPDRLIVSEANGATLLITLNRPDKSNSLHPDLVEQLHKALDHGAGDSNIRVIVITGAGRSFCAGLDLELLLRWTTEEKLDYLKLVTSVFYKIWTAPQPVIAAVNGAAIAGGFDLAAFCDIRLASSEAVFGQAEINLGLTQIIHPLYKSIGLARAKELAMTGMNISADEAFRIGLVNHVYPREQLIDRAMDLASMLASKPKNALFETKRLTRELIDLDTWAAFEEIGRSFKALVDSDEHRKRVAETVERVRARSR
jgi:enoyl-CoA hydratase